MPSNDTLLKLFGGTPLWHPQTNGCTNPAEVLADRAVLLYFSASWCVPCVRFTPKLIRTYNNLKERGVRVEIVFCSMDTEVNCYTSYARKMPWFAIPFDYASTVQQLANRFDGNQGIPHLAVIDANGNSLPVDDAVSQVTADPMGTNFPWPPKPLSEILPERFCRYSLSGSLDYIPISELQNKYVMLYFAAHWSAPCLDFGPKLDKCYATLKKHRQDFELLLVSADRCVDEFHQHLSGLSFCAIPFESEACRVGLMRRLKIRGGPAIVMLGPNMEVINDCVQPHQLLSGDYISDFPFHPRQYGDLKDSPMVMNQQKCVLIFCENGDDELQQEVTEACKVAAEELHRVGGEEGKIKICWCLEPDAVSSSLRQATQLPGAEQEVLQMILLDLPDNGAYYVATGVFQDDMISSEDIVSFCRKPGVKRTLV